MTRIELKIDNFVLEGIDPRHRGRVVSALEKELTRLFMEKGAPQSMSQGGDAAEIDAGALKGNPPGRPGLIGEGVAQLIYKGLAQK